LAGAVAHAVDPRKSDDVIAKVGDQTITLSQIDTIINSSSFVGMDIPAVGTPERERARIVTLDKMISANLLYLDAKKKKMENEPGFQANVDSFSKGILAGLYRSKVLVGEIEVTEAEIQDFTKKNFKDDVEITDDLKLAAEAMIRKDKHKVRTSDMRQRLRSGTAVTVKQELLAPEDDAKRKDAEVIATVGKQQVTWGEAKDVLTKTDAGKTLATRLDLLENFLDDQLMTHKALQLGMDKDEVFRERMAEFKKARLVNMRRTQLIAGFEPDQKTLQAFYKANKQRIIHPESREIQMVVLKTEKEAKAVLAKIKANKLTIHEAAAQYSIDPNVKQTLGVIGWVAKGTGYPALDKLAFAIEKEVVAGPVQSEAGWHLVKVLDIHKALYENFQESNTQELTRRMYFHDKLNNYVSNLRLESFPVEVYGEVLKEKTGIESPEATPSAPNSGIDHAVKS
jgi:peptidyl-prolyl cis-trans isomerase C